MAASPEMICILGATATGKTRVAVALSRMIHGEIISADSRQVYRGMDIGTGKDLCEYGEIPHHLIDIADPGYEFNLFEFQRRFLSAYDDIRSRGFFPVLCGGTGLYIDAVLRCYRLMEVGVDRHLRAELDGLSSEELQERLAMYRVPHNTTDFSDRERLVRAIEIAVYSAEDTGTDFPAISTGVFGLRLGMPELRQRIVKRLKNRIESGMIEEVDGLLKSGTTEEVLDFYGLEYRYVARFIGGKINSNDMFQQLSSAIYQFARRQEKWFRRMERNGVRITWFPADLPAEEIAREIRKASFLSPSCRP